jgi:hypothetical protein
VGMVAALTKRSENLFVNTLVIILIIGVLIIGHIEPTN